uniref:Pepsin-I3 domain-containing protein n=1 Tax=Caenorhabditis japonica TaxID=281687 RepID=A0A8R1E3A8_CAEJA
MPVRPTLPSFCTGADTTMYIFGACTVQNNKVYIGSVFARELEEKEKSKLAEFSKKLSAVKPGTTPPSEIYKGLEFCTEL